MSSRLLLNLLLAGCVAALAAFLFSGTGEPPTETITRLTDTPPGSISRIKIERQAQEPILFTRQEGGWLMTSPYQMPASEARINSLLRLLTVQSHARLDANAIDLTRFRLDPPQVTLRLDDHVFLFGDTEALDERRYVLTEDSVHLINDTLYPQLIAAATFFISPRLLPDAARLLSLQLPEHTLQRTDNQWTIEPAGNIDPATLPVLIKAWQQASAITVSPYAQGQGSGEIHIRLADGGQLLFLMISPPPKLILARPDLGIQYHIDSNTAEQLFVPEEQDDMTGNAAADIP